MSLFEAINNLSAETKKIFDRIFEIRKVNLSLKNFEKFGEFKNQELLFIKDKVLFKEAIFNLKRSKRPQPQSKIEIKEEYDPFCDPENLTPPDEIGRLKNESAITSANLSKMADYHSLIIFKKHNLREINESDFVSTLNLAREWFDKIKNFDSEIKIKILIWNYHYRSAASILHPHFQVLAYKDIPIRIKFLKERLESYKNKFKTNYFEDYFKISEELRIGDKEENLKIWLSLTPEKEKGINFHGDIFLEAKFFWKVLKSLIEIGSESFNIFYNVDLKFGFFVDRGEITKKNSDFGALEIFGLPIVSFDPLDLSTKIFNNI